jgi:Flp pilus assembly pilin Flp
MLGDWFKKKFGGGVDAIKEVFGKIGDWFKEKWNAIKKVFSNVGDWFKEKFQSAVSKIKNVFGSISSWFSNIKNKITSAFSNIKEKISQPFEKARDVIKGVVDKIKGFFNSLKLKLPKIKLPHFKVTGKLSISQPSVPKLSIDWYKKAMNNPMIMNDPTIFGYNPKTGSFMGGGEAGSEVVSGTNTLMGMIRSAVSGEIGALTYYMQQLVNMLADYFPQVLELQAAGHVIEMDGKRTAHILAKPMDAELGKIQKDKERGK